MAIIVKQLTNTKITNAKPKDKDYTLTDGRGLYLLVKPNGLKVWRFRYKRPYTKKLALLTLGRFPETTLQYARQQRDQYLSLLAQQIDPQQHEKQIKQLEQQRITNTFKNVAESWKNSKAKSIKPLTLSKYWRIIELYLMPTLANYPIDEIKPILAKTALEVPYKQGKAEMYRKSVKLLNAILNYAVYSLFLIPVNPCEKISIAFEPLGRGKNPNIKPDELPTFLDKLENSNIDLLTKYLIQWQLLTMVRPNEAVTAEWTEIDFSKKLWTIPAEKMKQTKANQNKAHLVPLSTQALSLLERIKTISANSPFLFPSHRTKTKHLNSQTANKAIRDNMGYKDKQTAHGLRKIASTYLHEIGIMPDVVEACLAHTIKGIRGVYNEADYLPHRKKALQKWGDYINKCKTTTNKKFFKIVA